MKIFTKQERNITILLVAFLIVGVLIRITKEKLFLDSSENLKLIAVSEEINSIYSAEFIADTVSTEITLVNINSADAVELTNLPGIGPALANRIIVDREQSGSYKNLEELSRVKGIGDKVLKKILPHITL